MKRVYWRPQKVSSHVLLAVGLLAVGGVALVQGFPVAQVPRNRALRIKASELARSSMQAIRAERLRRGHVFPETLDPGQTGMIGLQMSPVTSLPGSLTAKRTSVNPNFAAVVVELLDQAGVGPGDCVAVGCTGSFPALNVALYAAMETMGVHPLIIHSAASSQYGANHPDMMWVDMERLLQEKGLISFRCAAVTVGGQGDRAVGMSAESEQVFEQAIRRFGLPPLRPRTLQDSIHQRMALYRKLAARQPIKAYVNVGGGAASLRGAKGQALFTPGLTLRPPNNAEAVDCVASRFSLAGVPVIHLGAAVELAHQYGLPIAPNPMPAVGEGPLFGRSVYNRFLASGVLLVIVLALRACVLTDVWYRLRDAALKQFRPPREEKAPSVKPAPQWMV